MENEVPIIFYNELDQTHLNKKYERVLKQLQNGDFTGAEVKKMVNSKFYRARLDNKDRLLFTWVAYKGKKHLLLLELITNHEYQKSRFLRGGIIPDEGQWMPLTNASNETPVTITYLNDKDKRIHALNKFISFDADQANIYSHRPPMVLIGSAGSGKTVLVLEKIKTLTGRILYTSLSPYLVDNARQLYYANGYENEDQEIDFLSFSQYLNSWQKPEGREIKYKQFNGWFQRHTIALKFTDAYKLFEEFNGVITGQAIAGEFFTLPEYLALGVRQSVYTVEERKVVYDLFKKYLEWMNENGHYDSNMLSHRYLEKVQPAYDYIIIDEVQDITNAQMQFILKSMSSKNGFILTGDSNQIVHPNFFSWAAIKTFFYQGNQVSLPIHILNTNYRNSNKVVQLSNRLLAIKNRRFGSIDKESNYLVKTNSEQNGEVTLLQMNDKVLKDLNQRTVQSAGYAVIVPTDEDKPEAAKIFKTPLLFAVHEAKGLEYENVILINFVSKSSKEFNVISDGIEAKDMDLESLNYARPANKADKEGDVYKFYINSLYVALTRALTNIYILEQQPNHSLLQLMGLAENKTPVSIHAKQSTNEEWLAEADKLEAQGKTEQAEQIRAKILGYDYITHEELEIVKTLALDPAKKENEVKRERKLLYNYAVNNNRLDWLEQLAVLQFQRAMLYMKEVRLARKEYAKNCRLGRIADLLPIVKKYGPDFVADEDGSTGIMIALYNNQATTAQKLMEMKASLVVVDKKHRTAFHHILNGYLNTMLRKQSNLTNAKLLTQFWHIAKPVSVKITTHGQLKNLPGHRLYTLIFWLMQCFEEEQKHAKELELREEITKRKNELNEFEKYINNASIRAASLSGITNNKLVSYYNTKKDEYFEEAIKLKKLTVQDENVYHLLKGNVNQKIDKLEGLKKNMYDEHNEKYKGAIQDLIIVLSNSISYLSKNPPAFSIDSIITMVSCLPKDILPDEKKKRTMVSGILSGHESGSNNPV